MAHNNTVIAQFMKLVPRHEFESESPRENRRVDSLSHAAMAGSPILS